MEKGEKHNRNQGELISGIKRTLSRVSDANSAFDSFIIGMEPKWLILLDDQIVDKVESYGYPKEYIMNCLECNETNYCTAAYYLMAPVQKFKNW